MDRLTKLPPRRWRAWTGTVPQVERLHSQVVALATARRDSKLAELGEGPDPTDKSVDAQWERRRFLERREEISAAYKVAVRIKSDDETIEGNWTEVMSEFDSRTYNELRLSCQRYGSEDRLVVTICPARRAAEIAPGIWLEVQSTDRGWALQSQAQVSDEIDRGVPRWAWMHSIPATVALGMLIYAAVVLPLLIVIAKVNLGWIAILAWIGVILVGGIVQYVATRRDWLIRRVLPPVEILHEGQDSSGSRAISFGIGVILIPIVLTFLAALWS